MSVSPMAPGPSIELLESCVGDSEDDGVDGTSVLAFSHLSAVQAPTICPRQIQRDRAHLAPLAPTLLRLLIPLTAPSSRNTPTITPRAALPFTAAATRYQSGGFFLGKPAAAVGMVILGCSGQERTHRGRCVLTGPAPALLDNHSALHGTMLTRSSNHHWRRNRFR